jgi:hypothetical protein
MQEKTSRENMVAGEKNMQSTYNVTMRRLHATTVAVEKQKILHIPSVSL